MAQTDTRLLISSPRAFPCVLELGCLLQDARLPLLYGLCAVQNLRWNTQKRTPPPTHRDKHAGDRGYVSYNFLDLIFTGPILKEKHDPAKPMAERAEFCTDGQTLRKRYTTFIHTERMVRSWCRLHTHGEKEGRRVCDKSDHGIQSTRIERGR